MRKGGIGSRKVLPHRIGSSNGSREAGRGAPPRDQSTNTSSKQTRRKPGGRGSDLPPKRSRASKMKDVPQHGHNVHKVGAVGNRFLEDALPLSELPATHERPA